MATEINTMGDFRHFLIELMVDLRSGNADVSRSAVIVAAGKVVNENILAEVAINKLALSVKKEGAKAVELVSIGSRLIEGSP